MRHRRRLTATILAVLALAGCSVHESTRSAGLVPPTGPAPTQPPATVVTVAVDDELSAAIGDTSQASAPSLNATVPAASAATEPPGETGAASDEPATTQATPPPAETGAASDEPATTQATPQSSPTAQPGSRAAANQVLAAAIPPDGFGEGILNVTGPQGSGTWPVIVADTGQARRQGLMGIADFAALGGYAAMVFVFDGDTSGAFWMRDTPLPLRITFVTGVGTVVSATDMVPCLAPTPSDECDRYFPGGAYRIAIEHPLGPDYDLGLDSAVAITLEP